MSLTTVRLERFPIREVICMFYPDELKEFGFYDITGILEALKTDFTIKN
jgi:hypothetical protein